MYVFIFTDCFLEQCAETWNLVYNPSHVSNVGTTRLFYIYRFLRYFIFKKNQYGNNFLKVKFQVFVKMENITPTDIHVYLSFCFTVLHFKKKSSSIWQWIENK